MLSEGSSTESEETISSSEEYDADNESYGKSPFSFIR